MKTRLYFLLLFVMVGWGCYEDKGNYDYREVNEVDFSILPASTAGNGSYIYRQPSTDTLKVTYRPEISQSMKESKNNLVYRWIVANKNKLDTVDARELTLKYPPRVETKYTVLFQVKDQADEISYYTTLTMKTQLPFMRSWLLVHGNKGDRRIGAVEDPDSTASIITKDVYLDLFGERKFQDAEHLFYVGTNGVSRYDMNSYEQLIVTGPDSVDYMYPYDFVIRKRYEDIIPNLDAPKIIGGFAINTNSYTMLMDEQHQLYHSGGEGIFYPVRMQADITQYEADKIYISETGYTTIWDEVNRQLLYYYNSGNYYDAGASYSNNSLLTLAPFRTTITTANGELQNREIIWLGKRLNTADGREGATLMVKDTVFTFYQINYNVQNVKVKMDSIMVKQMDINENSCFATSLAFVNQVFYSTGNSLYLMNLVNGEVRQLYNAGGRIARLQFRTVNRVDPALDKDDNFKLAIVVNKGNQGELHELHLSQSGDIIRAAVYTDFGPIQDICYTLITWNMFDEI